MSQKFLIQSINSIFYKYKQITSHSGDNYNIFKVLNIESNEVKLHTAFIADLLNPKGTHGFKSVFLQLFLVRLKITDFDYPSATIKVEQYPGKFSEINVGRIDIDIKDKNGYHIIIENKINADDQENQLLRYFCYGKDQCKKFRLYYLTLEGEKPDEEISCSDSKNDINLLQNVDYFIISYREQIKDWLENCREKATNKPLLREAISHYINLIKYMTNQSLNSDMNEEVIRELLKPNHVKNLANLKESIILVQIELQKIFWGKLIQRLKDEKYDLTEKSISDHLIREYYLASKNNKYYGIEIRIDNKDLLYFRYGIRIDHYIHGGFSLRKKIEEDNKIFIRTNINQNPEYQKYVDIVKSIDSSFTNDDYWLGKKNLQPKLNFRNINEDTCNHLSNLDDTISIMVQNITDEINFFKDSIMNNSED